MVPKLKQARILKLSRYYSYSYYCLRIVVETRNPVKED